MVIDPETGAARSIATLDESFSAITFLGFFGIAELFSASLIQAGSATLAAGDLLAQMPLHGAHHRPLLVQPNLQGSSCVWASGDLGSYRRNGANASLAEIGGCHDFIAERLRLGVGLGKSFVDQDLDFGGDADVDGRYVITEVNYRLPDHSVIGTVNFLYGWWDADINRHYEAFGSVATSAGSTDMEAWSARVRLDWYQGLRWKDTSFTPRIEFTVANTQVDGYAESGGPFPATFDRREQNTQELRGGVDVELQMSNATKWLGMVEGVHRFDGSDPPVTGTLIGQPFSFSASDSEETWARVGLGVEHTVTRRALLSATVSVASRGRDPRVSGSIALTVGF